MHDHIFKFSIDALVNMLARIGRELKITTRPAEGGLSRVLHLTNADLSVHQLEGTHGANSRILQLTLSTSKKSPDADQAKMLTKKLLLCGVIESTYQQVQIQWNRIA